MVAATPSDHLGDLSPGVFFAVIGSGLVLMALLVASCWLV